MTTLMVQTDRLIDNLHTLQNEFGSSQIIPVVSGNAYGLGDVAIVQLLASEGIKLFAVSRIEEAAHIKEAVRNVDILLLTPYSTEEEIIQIVNLDLIATVDSPEGAVLFSGIAGRMNKKVRIHLKFDCGYGRFGFLPESASRAAQSVKYLGNLAICGTFTQLSNVKNKKYVEAQLKEFNDVLQTLNREGIDPGICHIACTDAAILYDWVRLDAVRIGSGLLGRANVKNKIGLKKVGRLVSEVCDVRWVPGGKTIGASGKFKTRRATKIAVVPIGYADGLILENKKIFNLFGYKKSVCEINGKKVPIIGKPEYTTTIIDVTEADCSVGDLVSFDISPLNVSMAMRRDYV